MGRFFWLRLQDNFFESADIKVVLSQENGPAYVCFWLRLLLLALKQEDPGRLRFKPEIPYDEKLLSTVLDTNIDFVRSALKLFSALGMIQKAEDDTLEIDSIAGMIGSESSSAERVRQFRERQKVKALHCNVTRNGSREEKTREDIYNTAMQLESVSEGKAAEYPAEFESLWAEYPRKIAKAAAYRKWQATLKKGADREQLLKAVKAYAAECQAEDRQARFIKHGATFFGPDEHWRDYVNGLPSANQQTSEEVAASYFGRA